MKTEPSEPIKIKTERNDVSYSSNTHFTVKQETKDNLDFKPTKISQNDFDIGGTSSVTKVTRTRKVRKTVRKVATRKSTYGKVKRKTKRRRKRKTTTRRTKGRRKRASKPLVTGKALTPRARLCKKLGIERNLSLGAHSLPTIRKMTQENLINKRAAAGIGVLSIFGSELNSHGSVPLRNDHPDVTSDPSGIDEGSSAADEQDSYGPQLPPDDIVLNDNNTSDNKDIVISNHNNTDNIIVSSSSNNIVNTEENNHEEVAVETKPSIIVNNIPVINTLTPGEQERDKKPTEIEEGEIAEHEGDKSKVKRCKHGKLIHVKKHSESSKPHKTGSSKENKKEESKSTSIKIKKEPRDRDEDKLPENREAHDRSVSSLTNRHEIDYPRRLHRSPPIDERTSKHRLNDGNRENHTRDEGKNDKRKHGDSSKETLQPYPPLPPLSPLPATSSNRSRVEENLSKHRSSHKRDSSRGHRSPVRRESRRGSSHYEPYESKTNDVKRKYDLEEEERSKGKKKKRKHKHKHSKYDEEDDYNETKSGKNCDQIDSNTKRIQAVSSDTISVTNHTSHDHHKKSKSRHRSRDERSLPSSHKISSPHRDDKDKPSVSSRSRSRRSKHSSPDRDHITNRSNNRESRRDTSSHPKSGQVLTNVNASTDELNTKEVKVKVEDNHKDHNATTANITSNNVNACVNNISSNSSKVIRSPSEIKSVLSKPGSPPKKDVRLVSKSRTEFDIFWDENSQNKRVDNSHPDYDSNGDKAANISKEETGLRFLPRTLQSDQSSPSVHLPATVGPRTPPDDEQVEKNIILSSPDQTMPTPTQDESLEGDYSDDTPTKQRSSIKSLNSPSIDPDVYDPEAPLEGSTDDQSLKSEIARSQLTLSEMEKKSSPPAEKQVSPVKIVPRPETPESPSLRSPHANQIKLKSPNSFNSPIIPPVTTTNSGNIIRVPTLAESSIPPAPGSLLAQIQQTLNLQPKTHSSHLDTSKQLQSHSGSTGKANHPFSSHFPSSIPSGSSVTNDQLNKSSSMAPNINALSPPLKSLLENLIKAAEQQQSKAKTSKPSSVTSNVNNIFKKPAPVLDSKSRFAPYSHHSIKTKVIDKEAVKKTVSTINQNPPPIGPGMKLSDVAVLDDVPSSAVELQVKEKYLKKLNRQERVVEEVKMVLKPFYQRKEITKDEYKEIMRKAVPKICHSKSGEINPQKVRLLVEGYIQRFKHDRKKSKTIKGK